MCTVTFIRAKNSFFFTSNRDEKVQRGQALPPKIHRLEKTDLLYPRDTDAGGTWIALNKNLNAAVLLNGAFINHQPQSTGAVYKRSRGLILVEVLAAASPLDWFLQMNLEGIEPFTLLLFQEFALYDCRWDGSKKFSKQLSTAQNHIWSSVTLYDETVQKKRKDWFVKWLDRNIQPSQAEIFHFHRFGGDGNQQHDIQMNRDGQLLTVSITGIRLTKQTGTMNYLDLKDGGNYSKKLNTSSYAFEK